MFLTRCQPTAVRCGYQTTVCHRRSVSSSPRLATWSQPMTTKTRSFLPSTSYRVQPTLVCVKCKIGNYTVIQRKYYTVVEFILLRIYSVFGVYTQCLYLSQSSAGRYSYSQVEPNLTDLILTTIDFAESNILHARQKVLQLNQICFFWQCQKEHSPCNLPTIVFMLPMIRHHHY